MLSVLMTTARPHYGQTRDKDMPRKRRIDEFKEQITDAEWKYLSDVPLPESFELLNLEMNFKGNIEQLWNQNRDVILAEHVKETPGTRPSMWWRDAAPRLPMGTFPGWSVDGTVPQMRLQLSGTPVAADWTHFRYGLPSWKTDDKIRVFESQAAYLKRHGLFFDGEEKRSDFEPEDF
jgi:hypothetical protein